MDPHINLDGSMFHKHCAKCKDCNCQITLSNFNKHEMGIETYLLCKTHFFSRFNEVSQFLISNLEYVPKMCHFNNCVSPGLTIPCLPSL